MSKTGTIIVAAGNGTRMKSVIPKQFLMLGDAPVLIHTVRKFFSALGNCDLAVVLGNEWIDFWKKESDRYGLPAHKVVAGGQTRFESVAAGLAVMDDDCDIIAVHDGARPLVSADLICRVCAVAEECGAAIPAVEAVDSFRVVEQGGSHTIDRSLLRAVQTPQVFRAGLLRQAYMCLSPKQGFTDDASAVEAIGGKISLVKGERRNIKITESVDMKIVQTLLNNYD